MTGRVRERGVLIGLALVAAGVFYSGIGWGLPSRAADPYLFGDRTPWTGRQIQALCGNAADDPLRGANVPTHVLDRSTTVLLNADDRARAEIVRRYRLYTYQPDEMTTMMALAQMKPARGDFDPRMYQYGGLFLYPVGALLKIGSVLKLIDLRAGPAYYLDHPDAFGRFYIVARGMVAAWGVAGVWIAYALARRLGCRRFVASSAALAYVTMPVVVNMAHEAKPHLPGAVLMLLTVLLADQYVRTGRIRWAVAAGAAAGAAFGMVLSAVLVFAALPAMALLRRDTGRRRIVVTLIAVASGIAVYLITNPYVAINAITNRAVLRSNLGNSADMYHVGGWGSGVVNAGGLIAEGASPVIAILGAAGVAAAVIAGIRWYRGGRSDDHLLAAKLAILLGIPAGLQLVQFVALAAGKPGEYGRFAVFLDLALMLGTMAGLSRVIRDARGAAVASALVVAGTAVFGSFYWAGFLRDCRPTTSRLAAAEVIRAAERGGAGSVAIWAEPAPYSMPPVDLFRCRLLLLPWQARVAMSRPPADIVIPPVDAVRFPVEGVSPKARAAATVPAPAFHSPRISWADRRFCVLVANGSDSGKPLSPQTGSERFGK